MYSRSRFKTLVLVSFLILAPPVMAKQIKPVEETVMKPLSDETSAGELAKEISNPVSGLISVPLQNNFDFGLGGDDVRYTLNIQPVVPFKLSPNWKLITRTVLPVINAPSVAGSGRTFGMGDVITSEFFSPSAPSSFIWGAGPVFLLPTATDRVLGSEKFGVGPTVLGLFQKNGWTVGLLANNIFSVAGKNSRPKVNQMLAQPFLAYNWPTGLGLTLQGEVTANWEAPNSQRWTAPVLLSLSKVTRIGKQPISFAGGPRFYVEKPAGGPTWGIRFAVTVLFPQSQ